MNKLKISIIVAMDKQRGIGKDNKLLWHIPEDLKHFKEITMGHPIIMGRKTFESIGRPLPGRTNIVITRNENYEAPGYVVVNSLEEALRQGFDGELSRTAQGKLGDEEIFIIGGGQIFAAALPLADKLYVTIVKGNPSTSLRTGFKPDVFFPEYEHIYKRKVYESDWQEFSGHRYKFLELEK